MSKQREVNSLMPRLTDTAEMHKQRWKSGAGGLNHNLLPEVDTAPYKLTGTWPGKNFMLVGNSFNLEARVSNTLMAITKRSASLAIMFEQARDTRRCVYLADVLSSQPFLEVLSRFELDWLRRMPPGTVIGPAYNIQGELIGEAFAVWRFTDVMRQFKEKVLVGTR